MDEYIQKYLDGDLTDEEAAVFARALREDVALDAELRTYERMLAAAAETLLRDPSPPFTDNVMERIEAPSLNAARARQQSAGPRLWWLRAAMAAGFALVFMIGYLVPRPGEAPVNGVYEAGVASHASAIAPVAHRLARLVYAPSNPEIEQVSVAGTFNGWNPELTTMERRGEVWVVQILLPPQTYEYMFVEDGEHWVTDPLAPQTRDDGFGRKNAVLDLEI